MLVVDGDTPIRSVLVAALSEEGYLVESARDGQQALTRLQGNGVPDVILVDLLMPGMDGMAFLRAYHARPGPHAPVVLTSTAMMRADEATGAGAAALLLKPFELDALLALVAGYIGRT